MIRYLDTDGVPAGSLVAVGMEWYKGSVPLPSESRLAEIFGHPVKSIPGPVSNAVFITERFQTAGDIALPARKAGATKVFVFRFEKVPKGEPWSIEAGEIKDEVKRWLRAFAVPGFIMKDPDRKDEKEDPLKPAKRAACVIGVGAAVLGLVLVTVHFMGS